MEITLKDQTVWMLYRIISDIDPRDLERITDDFAELSGNDSMTDDSRIDAGRVGAALLALMGVINNIGEEKLHEMYDIGFAVIHSHTFGSDNLLDIIHVSSANHGTELDVL